MSVIDKDGSFSIYKANGGWPGGEIISNKVNSKLTVCDGIAKDKMLVWGCFMEYFVCLSYLSLYTTENKYIKIIETELDY